VSDELFEAASARVTYQLSFRRCTEIRRFVGDTITSPSIDNAYKKRDKSPGEWIAEFPSDLPDAQSYLREFFAAAISEAVHEVCEWFRVDGRLAVDPHNDSAELLIDDSMRFGRGLFDAFAS
jgi:hypothetical protein